MNHSFDTNLNQILNYIIYVSTCDFYLHKFSVPKFDLYFSEN